MQHFQCWCYSYPTSTCLTANTLTSARATSVLTHLIKYNLDNRENSIKKALDEIDPKVVPKDFKILYSNENEKAYIKSYLSKGIYINIYVAKNSKNENCYPIVSLVTPVKLSEKEIEEATENFLNEAESFLK